MIKRDELTNPKSCMSRAKDDEMTFVLLGRDAAAPVAIRAWVRERIRLGKNVLEDPQIQSALLDATAMDGLSVEISEFPMVPYAEAATSGVMGTGENETVDERDSCSRLASRVEELEKLIAKQSGCLNSADSASGVTSANDPTEIRNNKGDGYMTTQEITQRETELSALPMGPQRWRGERELNKAKSKCSEWQSKHQSVTFFAWIQELKNASKESAAGYWDELARSSYYEGQPQAWVEYYDGGYSALDAVEEDRSYW